MKNVSWILNRLKENKAQIVEARKKLDSLLETKNSLTEQLQASCSHPPEYTNRELTNPHADPLEADHFRETCMACGKVLESYSIFSGIKHYGERDVRRED